VAGCRAVDLADTLCSVQQTFDDDTRISRVPNDEAAVSNGWENHLTPVMVCDMRPLARPPPLEFGPNLSWGNR